MLLKCKYCGCEFNSIRSTRKYCSKECSHKDREYNLIGKTFGNLKVIKRLGTTEGRDGVLRLCRCTCGKEVKRYTRNLTSPGGHSCGCGDRTAYGMVKTKFYHKYNTMKLRCESPQAHNYKLYGGRGIKCERKTFQEFYKDMYNSYYEHCQLYGEENTTIERIDVNGNYCKSNCKRATLKEQANNKRNNRMLTYKGITQSLEMWSKTLGITYRTLYHRLRRGMPFEFIVEHPHEKSYTTQKICVNSR